MASSMPPRSEAGTWDRNDLTKVRFSAELTGEPSAIEARPSGVISLASAAACSAAFIRSPDEVLAPCVKRDAFLRRQRRDAPCDQDRLRNFSCVDALALEPIAIVAGPCRAVGLPKRQRAPVAALDDVVRPDDRRARVGLWRPSQAFRLQSRRHRIDLIPGRRTVTGARLQWRRISRVDPKIRVV